MRHKTEHQGGAPVLERLRLETFAEGLAVPTLHIGPYDEGSVLQTMHEQVIPRGGAQDHPAPIGRSSLSRQRSVPSAGC